MSDHPLRLRRKHPSLVHLYANGFCVSVFTNDCGICVQITSDQQRPGETPLTETFRPWDKPTA